MIFRLSQRNWSLLETLLLQPCRDKKIKVWIFGSRARGDHQKFSDLDLLYAVAQDIHLPEGFISQLKQGLEDSNMTIKIDFVNEEDLAESYRENVMRERILLE